ncbi:hypothetical protein K7459_29255, partial [Pseudomonas fluorescens]|nr:hypothetical protein [Pseudomonas fluorescens]
SRGSAAFLNGWRLFGVYLTYIVRQTKFENWNPCSGYVHNAQEASANSLDAWAIGLCVAVEGLASMIKLDEDKAEKKKREIEKKRLKKLQEFIVKQVSSRQRLKAFAPRIGGLVGNLHALRAIDRMTWLAKRGGLDRKHIEAWKWLRNRGVHPSAKGDIDIASVDFQEFLDELNRVTVLLYHIVFYLIGYRGPYTDYGLRNVPAGQYTPDGSKNEIADSAT